MVLEVTGPAGAGAGDELATEIGGCTADRDAWVSCGTAVRDRERSWERVVLGTLGNVVRDSPQATGKLTGSGVVVSSTKKASGSVKKANPRRS